MGDFDDMFADGGAPGLVDVFGSSAVVRYLDPELEPVTLTARLSAVANQEIPGPDGGVDKKTTRAAVINRDPTAIGGGVAEPVRYSEHRAVHLEIDGLLWIITAINPQTETESTLQLELSASQERSRENYRGS